MRNIALAILVLATIPAFAAEEFVTSAFRTTLPEEWQLKRGGQSSTLLEDIRKPDCEFGSRLYENEGNFLSIAWSANQSFDYNSPNWGPATPMAAYDHALATWAEKARTRELIDVETVEPPLTPPVIRLSLVRAQMPHLKRNAYYVALLREEGIATIEMLTAQSRQVSVELIASLVDQASRPATSVAIPACSFKGKGGPSLWRTWQQTGQGGGK